MRAAIAMTADINDKGLTQRSTGNFISAVKNDIFKRAALCRFLHGRNIKTALAGHETQVKTGNARRRRMQHIEAGAGFFSQFNGRGQNGCAIVTGQSALPDNNHRVFSIFQRIGKTLLTGQQIGQRVGTCADKLGLIGQVNRLTDRRDWEIACEIALADTRIENRRFEPRIAADKQERIGFFNTRNACIEQIIAARAGDFRAVLAAIDMRALERVHQPL